MILITGINGFIGSHIAKILIGKGFAVRGLVRATSNLTNLEPIKSKIELVFGDILDESSLKKAFSSVDICFHTAALVKVGRHTKKEYLSTNLQGTINVCNAAIKAGVKKFIYTSTCETLRYGSGEKCSFSGGGEGVTLITENIKNNYIDMVGDYGRSKFLAEEHVKARVTEGLPAVIVNPTAVIGPCDINNIPPNALLTAFYRQKIPFYFETGFNVTDVRDVAIGHVLALERGMIGERYILGTSNVLLSELFKMIRDVSHKKIFSMRIPYTVVDAAVKCLPIERSWVEKIRASKYPFFLESSKAGRELGWRPAFNLRTSIKDALDDKHHIA